ncbi:flexible cuticle protein 12-like [Zophobas morio]|uniref:flexible cuticle protein 12-like n=1 Tax=Zophobas morio TaxID=2755281 RepID=UPI0030838644
MKFLLIVSGIFGVVMSQNPYHQAYTVRYDNDNDGLGQYRFGFETSDGFRHDQSGQLQNVGTENEGIVMKGSYSYIGPDGVTYTVYYTADENGFHPEGAHIPQSAGVGKAGNLL